MRRKSALAIIALVVIWGTLAVIRWGRPYPWKIVLIGQLSTDPQKGINQWRLKDLADGETIIESDTNQDGRVDQIQWGNPGGEIRDLSDISRTGAPPKKLIICLDGVPYDDMAELWDRGYFREFARPGKLISVFPSLSDVALTAVLHTPPVPGYENLYFDLGKNQIGGGAFSTVSKIRMPYLDALDYDEPGIFKGLAYILPMKTYYADVGRFNQRIASNSKPVYTAHICSTDAICHILTREEFMKKMTETDRMLREVVIRNHANLDIVVFSDHGNSHVTNHRIDLDAYLAPYGFRIESSIRDEWSVAIPKFGLVGAMPVYTQPTTVGKLVPILVKVEGIDFVAYLARGEVRLVSAKGEALIHAEEGGKRLRYEALQGDPLELKPILERMSREQILDSDGFATPDQWFSYTAEHEYADAINALYLGMNNHVTNRASLMVSFKDGYHYGSPFFDKLVTMRSTHGNLHRMSMTGFYMRNRPMPDKILAARELLADELH
ncbi:MAG: hypothetical protein U0V70_06340 [Terriglobia bacterium]